MTSDENTLPALKEYDVWADRRVFQHVEATSPEDAFRIAQERPGDFEPCSHGIENFEMCPVVMDLQSGEEFRVDPQLSPHEAADTLRRASQELYDQLQDYLDVPDSELPPPLVAAMDGMEAAWREADGRETENER